MRIPSHFPQSCWLGSSGICPHCAKGRGKNRHAGCSAVAAGQWASHFSYSDTLCILPLTWKPGIWPRGASSFCHLSSQVQEGSSLSSENWGRKQDGCWDRHSMSAIAGVGIPIQLALSASTWRWFAWPWISLHLASLFQPQSWAGFRETFVRLHNLPPSLLSQCAVVQINLYFFAISAPFINQSCPLSS